MIVEHTFVTTHDAQDALDLSGDLLARLEFGASEAVAQAEPDHHWREWRRGAKHERTRYLCRKPTRIRLEFDRGRITAGIAINVQDNLSKHFRKFGLAIASGLEAHLVSGEPAESALKAAVAEHARLRRKDRNTNIALMTVLTMVLGMVGLIIYSVATN
jgi:hypothetical protein